MATKKIVSKTKPATGKKPAPEEARQWLAIVEPDYRAFWVSQGPVVRSLKEMASVLPRFSREVFEHHVNAVKNDLAAWVREVIGDRTLAERLEKTRTMSDAVAVLEKRLLELDRVAAPKKSAKRVAKKK
ncbi:MAG: hypothetical protein PHT12_01540 [Patescibacteria group bacterium]|nr:hypothetical protein [Patescibacteria group bacterium]